jgi:hypothetical protein
VLYQLSYSRELEGDVVVRVTPGNPSNDADGAALRDSAAPMEASGIEPLTS